MTLYNGTVHTRKPTAGDEPAICSPRGLNSEGEKKGISIATQPVTYALSAILHLQMSIKGNIH